MTEPGTRWLVALAEPNAVVDRSGAGASAGHTVMDRLEAVDASVFCPMARIMRVSYCPRAHARVPKAVWIPVFGRYLFIGTDRPAGVIRAVRGISHLVNDADGNPGVVPQETIDELEREFRGYKIESMIGTMKYRRGQTVRIIEGPFTGVDAEVESLRKLSHGLLKVVTDILGRKTALELRIEDVEGV